MNVYQTDKNGFLVGQDVADEDPMNPGSFLIPGGCVTVPPPALVANETAQLVNGAWAVVPDFRGKVYWLADGSRHEITDAGVALPSGALDAEPTAPLPNVKAAKVREIETARDAACALDVTALGTQWQADDRSQKLLSSAITLASAGLPLPSVWRDSLNNDLAITSISQLLAIAGAMAVQTQAAYAKSWTLKAQVNAASDVATINAVVW